VFAKEAITYDESNSLAIIYSMFDIKVRGVNIITKKSKIEKHKTLRCFSHGSL